MAYTQSQYLTSINKYADSCSDMNGSCKRFKNPPRGWVQKIYTIEGDSHQLILAHANKTIDLFRCTEQDLCDFIGITDQRDAATIRVALSNQDSRGLRELTTFNLFTIIKVFKQMHQIKLVRIIDESCNLSKQPLIEGFGYGGQKSKRNKTKRFHLRSRKITR
jgi:hypothetical protein